jgi:hypothetical protein
MGGARELRGLRGLRSPRTGWALVALGVLLMLGASLWAPAQPEFLHDGAACEIAPCGTLEDPSRWAAAWWPWTAGALAAVLGAVVAAPPRPRPRWWAAVLGVLVLPVLLVVLLFAGIVLSWWTSVHGGVTVLVLGLALPLVLLLAGVAKGLVRRRDQRDSRVRSPVA